MINNKFWDTYAYVGLIPISGIFDFHLYINF